MQTDTPQELAQTPQRAGTHPLRQSIVKYWNTVGRFALLWATIGSVAGAAWTLPTLTAMIAQQGYVAWLLRSILPAFTSAFILIVTASFSARSGKELVQRPVRFILAMALGSAVAVEAAWAINLILPSTTNYLDVGYWFLSTWLTILLFGCAFGWPAVLNVKRHEEQAALTQLLMQRSLLARRLAQARLFAARAQVDPEMVARVLTQVRQRYATDASSAAALLDDLIAFLRLAMNRKGGQRVQLGSEIDMLRSYASLHQIETGKTIALQIDLQQEAQRQTLTTAPFYLLMRQALRSLSLAQSAPLALQITISLDAFCMRLHTGLTPLAPEILQALRSDLAEILANAKELDILHQTSDKGEHQYVVQAAIG